MNNPALYFSAAKETIGRVNSIYLPKLFQAVSWDFEEGHILDYGSGPGNVGYQYLLPKAEQTNSTLHFVDISPEMVEYSKKHFVHPRIVHEVGSLPDNFPISKSIDCVVVVNVFHLMSDVRPMLKGFYNVLKPGGQLAFATATIDHIVFRTLKYLVASPEWNPFMKGLRDVIPKWSNVPEGADAMEFYKNFFVESTGMREKFFLHEKPAIKMEIEYYLDFAMSGNRFWKDLSPDLISKLREAYRYMVTTHLKVPLDSKEVNIPNEYVFMVLQK